VELSGFNEAGLGRGGEGCGHGRDGG
jgi:hypothetical protein